MSSIVRRRALRIGTVLGVATLAALSSGATAFAHVTPQPDTAEQGGYAVIAMRVPNESDTAGTVSLQVTLPTDHPITSVRTEPRPGWTATMTKETLNPPVQSHGSTITEAVRAVTWTAAPGTRIGPGEFTDFPLSLGPLPTETDQLLLPAVQTYDDGEVVAWDQLPSADGAEPEHPAPTVTLTPATDTGPAAPGVSPAAASGSAGAGSDGTDSTARWLGGAGLLVGALGLGLGVGAALRSRRTGVSR